MQQEKCNMFSIPDVLSTCTIFTFVLFPKYYFGFDHYQCSMQITVFTNIIYFPFYFLGVLVANKSDTYCYLTPIYIIVKHIITGIIKCIIKYFLPVYIDQLCLYTLLFILSSFFTYSAIIYLSSFSFLLSRMHFIH